MFRRILKALFALFFGQVLTRFGSFILVPIFTKQWSPTVYGEWLTLSATVLYIASLDLGINQAAINRLTQIYASGNISEYKTVQHSALKFFILIAAIGLIIFAIILGFIPFNTLLGIETTPQSEASITLLILSAYVLISLPARMVFSIYQTTGNLAKTQWIQNIQAVFFLLLTIFVLLNGYGMIYVAAIQLTLQILSLTYVLIDSKINYPEIYPGTANAQNKIIKELFKPGLLFTLIMVANIIWYQGSILLISSVYGGLLVATFSVTRTLSLLPRQIVSIFYSAVFPDIAILKGKNDNERLRIMHRLLIIISTGLAVLFFSLFWFSGSKIISLWTLGEIIPDTYLLYALLILVLFQTPYLSSAAITLATNQHKNYTKLFFISQLTGFILSILTINKIGIVALPVSFFIAEMIFCFYFVIQDTCKKISEDFLKLFYSSSLHLIILLLLTMLFAWFIFYYLKFSFLFNIVLTIFINGLIIFIYTLEIWMSNREKELFFKKIRNGQWRRKN